MKEQGPLSDLRRGHEARYRLASGFLMEGDYVLDAACGCGYGSRILAEKIGPSGVVFAMDYSQEAIDYAGRHYPPVNAPITHRKVDLTDWEPGDGAVDVAVSFETIEHLDPKDGQELAAVPREFARKLKRVAKRMIIISAPIIPTVGINPSHHHDFTDKDMLDLFIDDEWVLYESFKQRVYGIYVFVKKSKYLL